MKEKKEKDKGTRTLVFRSEQEPNLYLVLDTVSGKVFTFKATPEQFEEYKKVMAEQESAA